MSVPALRSKDPAARAAVGGGAVSVPVHVRKVEGFTPVEILASVRWLPKSQARAS